MGKTTKLCKLKKDEIDKDLERVAKTVRQPTHICRRCARAANVKKALCKPVPLPE